MLGLGVSNKIWHRLPLSCSQRAAFNLATAPEDADPVASQAQCALCELAQEAIRWVADDIVVHFDAAREEVLDLEASTPVNYVGAGCLETVRPSGFDNSANAGCGVVYGALLMEEQGFK